MQCLRLPQLTMVLKTQSGVKMFSGKYGPLEHSSLSGSVIHCKHLTSSGFYCAKPKCLHILNRKILHVPTIERKTSL